MLALMLLDYHFIDVWIFKQDNMFSVNETAFLHWIYSSSREFDKTESIEQFMFISTISDMISLIVWCCCVSLNVD